VEPELRGGELYKYQEKKGEDEVKVINFSEYSLEDFEKVAEKFRVAMADRAAGSTKFPKVIFPAHGLGGEPKVITIYEDATEEQLNNLVIHYMPEMTCKFVQLQDGTKFIEQYFKQKKK